MIAVNEFRAALKQVAPCSSAKETLPAFSTFAFVGGRVLCSNGKAVACSDLEAGFDGLVEAQGLLSWLKALPKSAGDVSVTRAKGVGSSVLFEAGKHSLKMSCLPASDFPEYQVPQTTESGVRLDKADTIRALKLCKGCMVDDFDLSMSGLFLEWDGKDKVFFRSTDKVAAIEVSLAAETDESIPAGSVCIPAGAVDHLIRTGGISEILFGNFSDDRLVWFRTSVLIGSRTRSAPELGSLTTILDRCGTGPMSPITDGMCEAFDTVAPVAGLNPLGRMDAIIWNGAIEFHTSSTTVVDVRASAPIEHAELDTEKRLAFSAPSLSRLLDYADEVHFPDDPIGQIQVRSDSLRGVMALIRA